MAEFHPEPNTATEFEGVLESAKNALVETLATIAGIEIRATEGHVVCLESVDLRACYDGESTVVRGAFGGANEGKFCHVVMASVDAATIAGHVMAVEDDVITAARDAGKLEGDQLQSFGDIAARLCSGLATKFGESLGDDISVNLDGHGTCTAEADPDAWLGDTELVTYRLKFEVANFAPTALSICVDRELAEAWNRGAFSTVAADDSGSSSDLPDVPTRGTIASYLADAEPYNLVRRACRRAGLDIDHRPSSEVPNPAAYRGKLVLIDVPVRDDRRFDWCRRLKDYDPTCRVLMMLRQPSRQRVVQGFLSRADIIVGWPLEEMELAAKLDEVFEKLGEPVADPVTD